MKTYQGIISKKEFVAELKKHQAADNFLKGNYWNGTKGCAVGCSLESIKRLKNLDISYSDYAEYPKLLGIPEWLAKVEDRIFEGLPLNRSKTWPVEFAQAISVGVDLEEIKAPFLLIILKSTLESFDHKKYPNVKKAIERSITLWKRKDIESKSFLNDVAAYAAAYAYAAAAAYAAYAAADVAAYAAAYAADAAAYAADAAAAAADVAAAYAADAAAYAAAYTADAAADVAAAYAADAARSEKWVYFANELLKLLKSVKK